MQLLRNSPQFASRVRDSLDSFVQMKNELDKEQRTVKRRWKKQELLIEKVYDNIANMYTTFQVILGSSIPELEEISGDHLLNANEDDENEEE